MAHDTDHRGGVHPAVNESGRGLAAGVDGRRLRHAGGDARGSGHAFLPDASTLATPTISLAALATSRQVTDAHLVNLVASSGAVLAALDRGIEQMLAPGDRRIVVVVP